MSTYPIGQSVIDMTSVCVCARTFDKASVLHSTSVKFQMPNGYSTPSVLHYYVLSSKKSIPSILHHIYDEINVKIREGQAK